MWTLLFDFIRIYFDYFLLEFSACLLDKWINHLFQVLIVVIFIQGPEFNSYSACMTPCQDAAID